MNLSDMISDFFGMRKQSVERQREFDELVTWAKGLPLDEARARVDAVLRNPTAFRLHPLAKPLPDWMQGSTREFFETYGEVVALKSELELGTEPFGPAIGQPKLNRIGSDFDLTEIVLAPSGDLVYQVDGSETIDEILDSEAYPTIYHYIVGSITSVDDPR